MSMILITQQILNYVINQDLPMSVSSSPVLVYSSTYLLICLSPRLNPFKSQHGLVDA
jgi:hypothetical protein